MTAWTIATTPVSTLLIILFFLLLLSAFFSGSETGIMAINRYRLQHLAKEHGWARRLITLLKERERLLGVILIGNNFVNIAASSIATIIGLRLMGETGIIVATVSLTAFLLVFGEITPKTLASLKPERFSSAASIPLYVLLKLLFPLAWLTNRVSMGILRMFGVKKPHYDAHGLNEDELLTLVKGNATLSAQHQAMMSGILSLKKILVEDAMVPRKEVDGIDLSLELDAVRKTIYSRRHNCIPIYEGNLDNIKGILHSKDLHKIHMKDTELRSKLVTLSRRPYFIPEGTSLYSQLLQFKINKERFGVVVDEYGDIQGILTIDDVITEIIGEIPQAISGKDPDIVHKNDGSIMVDASISLRKLNATLGTKLPTENANTLNGLVCAHLDGLPSINTCLEIAGIRMEVIRTKDNTVKKVKFYSS